MEQEALIKTGYDAVYLLDCLINETEPEKERIDAMNMDNLYSFAKFHRMLGLIGYELQGYEEDSRWEEAVGNALYRTVMFATEKEKITDAFERKGIWYLLIKGSNFDKYYPEYGIREFADCDILVDETRVDDVRKIMLDNGYSIESFGKGHHDVYQKKPIFNFEIHRRLFGESEGLVKNYYHDMTPFLLRGRNDYEKVFSMNDNYVYTAYHDLRHFDLHGTGLRNLTDLAMMIKKESLDFTYIEAELKKMGLDEKEKAIRKMIEKQFFKHEELNEEEKKLLEYFITSGVNGTFRQTVINRVSEYGGGNKGKRNYVLRRLFPKGKELKRDYPFFYEHRYLTPILFVYRMGKAVFQKPKEIIREIKIIRNADKD